MNTHHDFEDINSSSEGGNDLWSSSRADRSKMDLNVSKGTEPKQPVENSTERTYKDDLFLFESDEIYGDEKPPMGAQKPLNTYSTKSKKRARRNIAIFNIITSMVLAVCIIFTGVLGAVAYFTGDMKIGEISGNHSDLGISADAAKLPKGIINIALFGIDSRSRDAENRTEAISGLSDTIIILSINTNNNTIKLASILRDSWVYINGGKSPGYNKINAAYSKGGPELAIKTLNTLFGLNITDYVSLSLYQLWEIVDIMGGVDIRITEAERKELNRLADKEGFNVDYLYDTGLVHLNGGQAMIYSRIRKIDSEGNRVLRQQKVINCLFEKAKLLKVSDYPAMLKQVIKYVETSLSYDEIFNFSPLLTKGNIKLQSTSVPGDEVVALGGIFEDTRGGWVWKYDMDEAKNYIHQWIYGTNK